MNGRPSPAEQEWSLHATAVLVRETGALIRGSSGSGKSGLAFALVAAAGSDCVRLIGDDRIRLSLAHGRLVARGHPRVEGMIELRWQGLVKVDWEPAAVVRCVVDLVDDDPGCDIPPRHPAEDDLVATLGRLSLPRLALPRRVSAPEAAARVRAFIHRVAG
jgi:HPr kinase/phosphorylase